MLAAIDIDWSVPEWLTVVGFPAVIFGLVLTRKQAAAAAKSAKNAEDTSYAVRAAVERTERQLADNHLLILIPQLNLQRRELDIAVERADRSEVIKLLGAWPGIASEVQAILEKLDPEANLTLIGKLDKSSRLTGKAKDEIIGHKAELEPATRAVRLLITEISASSGKIVGGMKAFTRSPKQ